MATAATAATATATATERQRNNGNSNNGNGNGGGGGGNLYAYIEITTNSSEPLRIDSTRLSEIDGDLDDGNTGSGYFQVSGMSIRYYLEQ